MKLTCDIVVNNHNTTSFNSRSSRGYLAIFRDSKPKPVQLLVFTSSKTSMKILMTKSNVKAVFDKYAKNGMSTFRFGEPSLDIMISRADPVQLAAFLKSFKAILTGEELPAGTVLSLSQATIVPSRLQGPRMVTISERHDYPFWQPFPSSIEMLKVQNCRLLKFDLRILKLKHLTKLELVGNEFSQGRLNHVSLASLEVLRELDLSNNQIDVLPDDFRLPKNLKALKLASNRLTLLPDSLFEDVQLVNLDLSNNQLMTLNRAFLNSTATLQKLDVSKNRLTVVPYGMVWLRLESIDLTANAFDSDLGAVLKRGDEMFKSFGMEFPSVLSLVELTAVVIAKNRLPSELLPPSLQRYVQHTSTFRCDHCRRYMGPSQAKFFQLVLNLGAISDAVMIVRRLSGYVPVDVMCCSLACVDSIRKMSQFVSSSMFP